MLEFILKVFAYAITSLMLLAVLGLIFIVGSIFFGVLLDMFIGS